MQTHRGNDEPEDIPMESDSNATVLRDNPDAMDHGDEPEVVRLDPQLSNVLEEAIEEEVLDEAEAPDDCEKMVEAHLKDAFCVDCTEEWIATGGEDDTAAVFRIHDIEQPVIRLKHVDSVISVKFNSTGTLLATGDMSGKILVTDMLNMKQRCEMDDCGDLEWMEWHLVADVLFAGGGDGVIWMYLVSKTGIAQTKTFVNSVGAACTAGRLLPDGKRLIAGYGNGAVLIWSLKDGSAITARTSCDCRCTVLDVDRRKERAIVGTENGHWMTINTKDGSLMSEGVLPAEHKREADANEEMDVQSGSEQERAPSVECAEFCTTNQWIAIGGNLGHLGIYEIGGSLRTVLPHDGQVVVKCAWLNNDSNSNTIVSATFDGKVRLWDARNGNLLKCYCGGNDEIYDFTIRSFTIYTVSSGGHLRSFHIR